MESGKKNYELEIMISGGTDASLSSSIRKARKELDGLEKQAGLSAKGIGDSFGGMSVKGIDALGSAADRVFGAIVSGGKAAAAGITAALGASAAVGMRFEAQMGTVSAISQASAEDMEKLTSLAKEMGETTQFTAEEAGRGLEYMAMAGWKTQDMLNGLPGVMYLAAASGEELGTVSDIVTDAMTAFGMNAGESARFADVLAQASASSNTNVAMMGETFQYIAPVAGAFGYTIEDVAVATGLMASAGIKGQKAGTAMRAMLTNLAKPTKQVQGYMSALSISLTDTQGNMKPFRKQMEELRGAFAGLTEAQRAEYAAGIAGKEGMSGLLAMVTASDADFEKLVQSIDASSGAARRMSEVRMDNLAGDLKLLESAARGAGIEVYGGMSDSLRELTQTATAWISGFTENIREDMPTIQRQLQEFGHGVRDGFQPVADFGGWCLKHPDVIKGTLTGIVTALGAFKGVQAAKGGVKLLGKLSGMMSAWPVAAFGLAAGAVAGIVTAVRENNKRLKKEDMARRFGDITLSMEELEETARLIAGSKSFEKASEAIEEMGKVKELSGSFKTASRDLSRLNWKIGVGMTLDDGDREAYADAVDKMVRDSIAMVEQSQYTAQISVRALFGAGNGVGSELIDGFQGMYGSINREVSDLGKQLGDAYREAMEDNIIDVNEAKLIQNLQEELASVTQQVSEAQFRSKLKRLGDQYSGKNLDPETFQNLQAEVSGITADKRDALNQSTEAIYAALDLQMQRGEIAPSEYVRKTQAVGKQYDESLMMDNQTAMQFSVDVIMDAYGDVFAGELPRLKEQLASSVQDSVATIEMDGNSYNTFNTGIVKRNLELNKIDGKSRDGIAQLWESMKPDFERQREIAESWREAGKEIPKAVEEGLYRAASVGMMAGDEDAIMHLMARSFAENPEYAEVIRQAQESGAVIPEEIAVYIKQGSATVQDEVNALGDEAQRALDDRFNSLIVNGHVNVNLSSGMAISPIERQRMQQIAGKSPDHYAEGGLISEPTLSWFAEDSPEMAIPIDGSARSMKLWRQTGELLGAYRQNSYDKLYENLSAGSALERGGTAPFAPVYSPVIQVPGGGDVRGQVEEGLKFSFEQFVDYMERFQLEKYREAF